MNKPALLAVCGVPEGMKARRLIRRHVTCFVPQGLFALRSSCCEEFVPWLWRITFSKSSLDLFLFKLKFFFYVVVWKDISGNRANKAKSEEKYIRRLRSNIVVFPTCRFFAFNNLESDEWHQVSQLFSYRGNQESWLVNINSISKQTQLSLKFL